MLKLLICLQMERKRKGEREREQKKRSGVIKDHAYMQCTMPLCGT